MSSYCRFSQDIFVQYYNMNDKINRKKQKQKQQKKKIRQLELMYSWKTI